MERTAAGVQLHFVQVDCSSSIAFKFLITGAAVKIVKWYNSVSDLLYDYDPAIFQI